MRHPEHGICIALVTVVCLFAFAAAFAQEPCTGAQIMTAKACAGDANSAEEKALFELVNSYRTANKLPPVRLSQSLSIVANRRMLDLRQNLKRLTHSWSDCKYDIRDEKTWHCVTNAPRKLKCGYNGDGYETLYRTAKGSAKPAVALAEWKKSQLHNSIILNDGTFKNFPWDEVGIAIDGEYATLWFGFPGNPVTQSSGPQTGYTRAVAGLQNIFTLRQSAGKESAATADSRVVLNLSGPGKEVTEVLLKLDGGQLSPQTRSTAASVLKNLFPEWPNIDAWLNQWAATIKDNPTASRTKLVRKLAIEIRSGDRDSLRLVIGPPAAVF